MKVIIYILALLMSVFSFQGCSGGGSDSANTPQIYTVSVTDIEIVRTVDKQSMFIDGLPVSGAEITVE